MTSVVLYSSSGPPASLIPESSSISKALAGVHGVVFVFWGLRALSGVVGVPAGAREGLWESQVPSW